MMPERFLDRNEARAFYDRFGRKQDWQRFYESPAIGELLEHTQFSSLGSVFELGCGTGAFAEELIEHHLPETATYRAVDISSTMVEIAGKRLARFAGRAEIILTDGAVKFAFADESFDCFVSNYVLDLLPPVGIKQALEEAYRLLEPDGRLCLLSLTQGRTFFSRRVTWLWDRIRKRNPNLVGGCRPVKLLDFVREPQWKVGYHTIVSALAIPSEVVVASKIIG